MIRRLSDRGVLSVMLMIVIFILVVLSLIVTVGMGKIRQSADDVRIAAGVVQFGLLARAHSEAQGGSYKDFDKCLRGNSAKCLAGIGPDIKVLVADVADAYAGSNLVVKVSGGGADFCVGATLGAKNGTMSRCVDSDAANTADQNLLCSNTAKCAVVSVAVPVVLP